MKRKKTKETFICSIEKLESFSQNLYKNGQAEHSKLVTIDNSMQISDITSLGSGERQSVSINSTALESASRQYNGRNVLIMHNHPDDLDISLEDLLTTDEIIRRFDRYGVRTVDHIVVGKSRIMSMKSKTKNK